MLHAMQKHTPESRSTHPDTIDIEIPQISSEHDLTNDDIGVGTSEKVGGGSIGGGTIQDNGKYLEMPTRQDKILLSGGGHGPPGPPVPTPMPLQHYGEEC